ncbi:hypothetical protein [Pseudarthrobacter sp. Y6]|uniref:hypothetical protein n=1 Tax=Pseudarthrobacter sp. Y6 TaxID=3418422 RepID=UPI003CF6A172
MKQDVGSPSTDLADRNVDDGPLFDEEAFQSISQVPRYKGDLFSEYELRIEFKDDGHGT